MILISTLALVLGAAPAAAVKTATVTYPSGSDTVSGYLAMPTTGGAKHPALIVIHEWWGQNEWVKRKAERFAREGYVALSVDLYRGQVANDPDTAHQLSRGLPPDRAQRDLEAAFTYLTARPDVDPARIGVIGWCMGGGLALDLVEAEPKLAAGVIYYGHLATDAQAISRIKTPLLGNFGAEDKGIPADSVRAFAADAKKAGVEVDFKIYPGAGHAFASASDPKVFKKAAAQDADARTDRFLAAHLAPKK